MLHFYFFLSLSISINLRKKYVGDHYEPEDPPPSDE